MKTVYSEEDAFAILFPDERSRQGYSEELARIDRNLVDKVRAGKVNPIRGWRVLREIDQKTLAKLTGISQANLSRVEKTGAPTPKVATLRKIASVLDVCIADLTCEH